MMEFEGKKKLLVGEVVMSAFSVFGNAMIRKSSEIWLEINFKNKTPTLTLNDEILVGKGIDIEEMIPIDEIKISKNEDFHGNNNDSKMTEDC